MRLKSEDRFAVDPRLTLVFGFLDLVLDPRFLDPLYGPSFVNFVSRYRFFFGEARVVSPVPRRKFVFLFGGRAFAGSSAACRFTFCLRGCSLQIQRASAELQIYGLAAFVRPRFSWAEKFESAAISIASK